jgi:hypothetical protein
MCGWNQPAQINNASALNLKNQVAVENLGGRCTMPMMIN